VLVYKVLCSAQTLHVSSKLVVSHLWLYDHSLRKRCVVLRHVNPLTTRLQLKSADFELEISLLAPESAGQGEVPKSANSMAASGLGHRKAWVGTGWAISLLLCMN